MLFGELWEGAQGLFRLARVTGGGGGAGSGGGGGGGSGGGGGAGSGGGGGGGVAADVAAPSDALAADPDALQLSSGGWLGSGLARPRAQA